MKRKPTQIRVTCPDCPPDCVTVKRIGDTVLTVRGYCASKDSETAKDELVRFIKKVTARECVNVPLADTG